MVRGFTATVLISLSLIGRGSLVFVLRRISVAMILTVAIAMVVFVVLVVAVVVVGVVLISRGASQSIVAGLFQFLFERLKQSLEIGGFIHVCSDQLLFLVQDQVKGGCCIRSVSEGVV